MSVPSGKKRMRRNVWKSIRSWPWYEVMSIVVLAASSYFFLLTLTSDEKDLNLLTARATRAQVFLALAVLVTALLVEYRSRRIEANREKELATPRLVFNVGFYLKGSAEPLNKVLIDIINLATLPAFIQSFNVGEKSLGETTFEYDPKPARSMQPGDAVRISIDIPQDFMEQLESNLGNREFQSLRFVRCNCSFYYGGSKNSLFTEHFHVLIAPFGEGALKSWWARPINWATSKRDSQQTASNW
jgi:hypothetical protein